MQQQQSNMRGTVLILIFHMLVIQKKCLGFLNYMNIQDIQRYMACPFHKLHQHEFACHEFSMEQTNRILSFQSRPKFNFYDPLVQNQIINKSIIFFGDSIMRNQFVSLACLLWEYDKSITESSLEISAYLPRIYSAKLDFDLFHLTHNHFFDGSNITNMLFPTQPLKLAPEIENALLGHYGHHKRPPDISLFSTGHHYSKGKYNSSCFPSVGCDSTSLDWPRFEVAINTINEFLVKISSNIPTKIIWRSVPARHYRLGEWNTNGTCHILEPCFHELELNLQNPSSPYYKSFMASEIIRRSAHKYKFHYIDVSRNSLDRCDGHVSNVKGRVGQAAEDCSHYCVPGVPDTWHDGLLKYLAGE